MLKKVLKPIIFTIIFLILFAVFTEVLTPKDEYGLSQLKNFYKEKSNTIDVLLMGTSHVFCGISPAVLYRDYGIAAYAIPASTEPPWATYYKLKEALKTQKPQLIILDVYGIASEQWIEINPDGSPDYAALEYAMQHIGTMRANGNKAAAAAVSSRNLDDAADLFLRFPFYHDRWTALGETGSNFDSRYNTKGFYSVYGGYFFELNAPEYKNRTGRTPEEVFETTERAPLTPKFEKYFRIIIELAQSEDIPLLLITTPYFETEYEQRVYNTIDEIASEYGVPFINFNTLYDEIGIKFEEDVALDDSHLNFSGAEKFTSYLGEYLKENYYIYDRRGDKSYTTWEETVLLNDRERNAVNLIDTLDSVNYASLAQSEGCTVFLYYLTDGKTGTFEFADAEFSLGENFAAVLSDDGVEVLEDADLFENGGKTILEYLKSVNIEISEFDPGCLYAFVYDNYLKGIVDAVKIKAEGAAQPVEHIGYSAQKSE